MRAVRESCWLLVLWLIPTLCSSQKDFPAAPLLTPQKKQQNDIWKPRGCAWMLGSSIHAARDCEELLDQGNVFSGWYTIYPDCRNPMRVLCDMHTDNGGWIVIQKRMDGSVDFFRDWNSYKSGFGSRLSEFWLGLENTYKLTSTGTWELRIDLQDFENIKYFAKYTSFRILGAYEKYQLSLGAFQDGNAGDSMTYQNNMKFSTKDQKNDLSPENCALQYKGAWWYNSCHLANLNGRYLLGQHSSFADGINWKSGKGYNYSYKVSEMKIRPVH